MDGYVRPDKLTTVPIKDGELKLSAGYDVLHVFKPLGAVILKYWNAEDGGMSNVMLDEEAALTLSTTCDLLIVMRPFIFASEYESLVQWRAENLTDEEYGL